MAKKPDKAAAPAKAGKADKNTMGAPKKSNSAIGLLMSACVILAILAPSACIIIPGMLPGIIALIGDRDREKSAGVTVGAMNAAGVSTVVLELWKMGHDFGHAFALLGQPLNWLIMYGAAGVGYAIYYVVPAMIASFMAVHAETRIKTLRDNQETLKRIWGPEVGSGE
jgi:hypothetical protein